MQIKWAGADGTPARYTSKVRTVETWNAKGKSLYILRKVWLYFMISVVSISALKNFLYNNFRGKFKLQYDESKYVQVVFYDSAIVPNNIEGIIQEAERKFPILKGHISFSKNIFRFDISNINLVIDPAASLDTYVRFNRSLESFSSVEDAKRKITSSVKAVLSSINKDINLNRSLFIHSLTDVIDWKYKAYPKIKKNPFMREGYNLCFKINPMQVLF